MGGSLTNVSGELNGGFLGGTGNYRKVDLEGRWYAPLGTLGGGGQLGAGVQFVLGLTAKSGFIFGDAGPFFTELYSLGGVQYGIPLRGYDEFSITPNGFIDSTDTYSASRNSFGNAFFTTTAELGVRFNQMFYINAFYDAGNIWNRPREFDPTRLYRGAGIIPHPELFTCLARIGITIDATFGVDIPERVAFARDGSVIETRFMRWAPE